MPNALLLVASPNGDNVRTQFVYAGYVNQHVGNRALLTNGQRVLRP